MMEFEEYLITWHELKTSDHLWYSFAALIELMHMEKHCNNYGEVYP